MAINTNFRAQYSVPPGRLSGQMRRNSQRFQRDLARELQGHAERIYTPAFRRNFFQKKYSGYEFPPGKGAGEDSVIRYIGAEILTRVRRRGGQAVHIGVGALVQGARAMPPFKQRILAHLEGILPNRPGGDATYAEINEWAQRKGINLSRSEGEGNDPVMAITDAINRRESHRGDQPFVTDTLADRNLRRRLQYATRKIYTQYMTNIGTRFVRRRSGSF